MITLDVLNSAMIMALAGMIMAVMWRFEKKTNKLKTDVDELYKGLSQTITALDKVRMGKP